MRSLLIALVSVFSSFSLWASPNEGKLSIKNCIEYFLPVSANEAAKWNFSKDLQAPEGLLGRTYLMDFHGKAPKYTAGLKNRFKRINKRVHSVLGSLSVYSFILTELIYDHIYMETELLDNDALYDFGDKAIKMYYRLVRNYLEKTSGIKLAEDYSNLEMKILPSKNSSHALNKIAYLMEKHGLSTESFLTIKVTPFMAGYTHESNPPYIEADTLYYGTLIGLYGDNGVLPHEIYHLQQEKVRLSGLESNIFVHEGTEGVWPRHRIKIKPEVKLTKLREKIEKLEKAVERTIDMLPTTLENVSESAISTIESLQGLTIAEKKKALIDFKEIFIEEFSDHKEDFKLIRETVSYLNKDPVNVKTTKTIDVYRTKINGYLVEEVGAYIKSALYDFHLLDEVTRTGKDSKIIRWKKKTLLNQIAIYLNIAQIFQEQAVISYESALKEIKKMQAKYPHREIEAMGIETENARLDFLKYEDDKEISLNAAEEEILLGLKWQEDYRKMIQQLTTSLKEREKTHLNNK